jgi:hypothetical protein
LEAINYKLFKDNFEFENYFHILEEKDIYTLCKFRTTNHKLILFSTVYLILLLLLPGKGRNSINECLCPVIKNFAGPLQTIEIIFILPQHLNLHLEHKIR